MKRIVILGGGTSGFGSAVLAQKKGYNVFLSDFGTISQEIKEKLDSYNIPYEEGGHTLEEILSAVEIIKSPGIPEKSPVICKIREVGIPIISEIEFAGRYLDGTKSICVTGSNGKTTTVSIIYQIMKSAGYNVALCGNIGDSFAYEVATNHHDWYILELSSFQLDDMYKYRADISLLLNITPDHLDRYDYKFENYAASKMRVMQNQGANDYFIYGSDDLIITAELENSSVSVQQIQFTTVDDFSNRKDGAYLQDGIIKASLGGKVVTIDPQKMILRGQHNTYNAMSASLATLAAGIDPHTIEEAICYFRPVTHRMEPITEVDGVLWINDSKATNVDSVTYALNGIDRPMVWIAGGKDKGNDYEVLKDIVDGRVHTLVCMGLDNQKLIDYFSGIIPNIVSTDTLEGAMESARRSAKSGDVVILSPACASFDLFNSYEHRGNMFREWVTNNCK